MSFGANFNALVDLKRSRLGLEENQQKFEQNRQTQFMPHEVDRMRLGNDQMKLGNTRSQFELDRAKGFMPFELRNAETDSAAAEFDLSRRKQFMPHELNKFGLENSALSLRNQSSQLGLAEQQRLNTFNADMEKYDRTDRATASRGLSYDVDYTQADRALSLQGKQYGLARQRTVDSQQDADNGYRINRRSQLDNRQDADYAYQSARRGITDTQQDADYGYRANRRGVMDGQQDADYNYQTGRRNLMDSRSDTEYTRNQASSYGYSGGLPFNFTQPQQDRPAIRSRVNVSRRGRYADGGPVQDAQAKGFVPVRVSNGEFEFTPEQVANIGAAVLANGGGKAQPPMGLDSMG